MHPNEGRFGILGEDTRPRRKAGTSETTVDNGGPLAPYFEADEAGFGLSGGAFEEKAATAGPNLGLKKRSRHERARIDSLAFRQPRSIRVGANLWICGLHDATGSRPGPPVTLL